eukprot:TRINITY_DN102197_c0_g1_i1.p1 TRINITY_DN102197_c0_g1~~TRINITY_DN102197_c0_g1_i1.p1  ORF type:complete len:633 (+),score=154.14 TRINITY_DN102197_c0_g1_i1:53-1900(+)
MVDGCCEIHHADDHAKTKEASFGTRPVMSKRVASKELKDAADTAAGPAGRRSTTDAGGSTKQDPSRVAELYLLETIPAGDWTKAAEVAAVLEQRRNDREVCRSAAKASERIACQERGLDALTESGAVQSLVDAWQLHRTDTSLAVHVHNIVARFWERASCDDRWLLLPAQLSAGKALLSAGHNEWLGEAHRAAVRLHEKGHTSAAMDLYRLCIERFEKTLGKDGQCTLQAQNNLAVLLEERQQYAEAEKLHAEVAKMLEEKLGADHADVLSSKFNQAALKAKMGRLAEGESTYRQVLEVRERTLGPQHADTLRVKGNLGEVIRRQGRLAEAEQLLKTLVDQRHVAFGRDDPGTLKARCQLAQVLAQQGDPAKQREAEAHLREVVARREQKLGRSHPDTLASLGRLAFLLEEKQPREAEQLNEQVWQRLDAAAPAERRRARTRQGGFLLALEEVGEPERAEAMLRQVADRRSASLGSSHPDTLAARAELAAVLSRKGDEASAAEALALRREVANLSETCLGADHVDTLSAKAALAGAVLRSCGPDANPADIKAARLEAEELHQQAATRFCVAANPMLPMSPSPPMAPLSPGGAVGGGYSAISPTRGGGKLAVLGRD